MEVRFHLRRSKRAGFPGVVYCTLSSNGVVATAFSTGIQAWPPAAPGTRPAPRSWQLAPVQRLAGTSPDVLADNNTLTTLYARIQDTHQALQRQGQPAGPNEVIHELQGRGEAIPTLQQAADRFLVHIERQVRPDDAPAWDKTGYSPNTVRKLRSRLGLLTEYLRSIQHPHMPLAKFTAKHADALIFRLMNRPDAAPGRVAGRARGKCGPAYAGKVAGLVSQVLDYAVNQEWVAVNPLASYSAPTGFDKPLVYLWPEQVAQLEQHCFGSPFLQGVADSFLFSCWTGLAWSDLDQFDAGRHVTDAGWLEMLRVKTGVRFTMPVLPGAARLLTKYADAAGGLPRYENQPLNRALKEIALVLGWELDLTHHVARRTFGMFLLNEGLAIETVSAVLGHRNVRTTQKHYAAFLERRRIAKEFEELQQRLQG